jgi:dTMP kinase
VIALVGVHGAGKTVALGGLGEWLRNLGHTVHEHPNESLRPAHAVLEAIAIEAGYSDEIEMLGPDTAKLCASLIKWNTMIRVRPAMEDSGAVVLMDRCMYCQYAAGRQLAVENEWLLRRLFAVVPPPDLTLYLDVRTAEALRRIERRGEEPPEAETLDALARAYRSLPEFASFVQVDANQAPEDVLAELCGHVERRFPAAALLGRC